MGTLQLLQWTHDRGELCCCRVEAIAIVTICFKWKLSYLCNKKWIKPYNPNDRNNSNESQNGFLKTLILDNEILNSFLETL